MQPKLVSISQQQSLLREEGALSTACRGEPDFSIIVARGSDSAEVLRIMGEEDRSTRLVFTDAARTDTFLEAAGELAEGVG